MSPRLVTARHLSVLVLCLARAAFAETGSTIPGSSTLAPSLVSGLDTQSIDTTVRPQDDFYRFVNGKWLDATEIPADKASFGSFDIRYEESVDQLRGIVEAAAQDAGAPEGSDVRRIGNLYRSFLDEARLETLGVAPLQGELDRIAAQWRDPQRDRKSTRLNSSH